MCGLLLMNIFNQHACVPISRITVALHYGPVIGPVLPFQISYSDKSGGTYHLSRVFMLPVACLQCYIERDVEIVPSHRLLSSSQANNNFDAHSPSACVCIA